jgi:agmatinase
MNYIQFPKNFGELEEKFSDYENSKVAVLPVCYEKTTSYVKGTANGPNALISASRNMELYDEELDKKIYEVGICTLNKLEIDEKPEVMVEIVRDSVKKLIDDKKFPVIIGGEHSITPGCVKAIAESFDDVSVLQLDAHADLRDEYHKAKFSHACAIRRCRDTCKNIVQVGIRSLSYEEAVFAKENKLNIFWAKDMHDSDGWMQEAISKLSKNVYITLDLDVFDPAIMPSTGTPEPGGLSYYQVLKFLKKLFKGRNIVGFDVMELCPNNKDISSEFMASKVIYKMIGYKFFVHD